MAQTIGQRIEDLEIMIQADEATLQESNGPDVFRSQWAQDKLVDAILDNRLLITELAEGATTY
jgi:hypothetical protein